MNLAAHGPLFTPTFGWIVLGLTAVALFPEMNGSAKRKLRESLGPRAPLSLLTAISVAAFLCGVPIGLGLILEADRLAMGGLLVAVALMAAFWLIARRYPSDGSDSPGQSLISRRSDRSRRRRTSRPTESGPRGSGRAGGVSRPERRS